MRRYGLFYISFGIVLWPSSGASAGYTDPVDNNNALGLYLITWFALSLVMWPVTWRLNVGLAVLFTLVVFYFLFLSIGFMSGKTVITTVGGYFGILVGSWGYILGMETLYATENNIFKLPVSREHTSALTSRTPAWPPSPGTNCPRTRTRTALGHGLGQRQDQRHFTVRDA